MGSWYTLKVGQVHFCCGSNHFPSWLLVPFQSTDVRGVPLEDDESHAGDQQTLRLEAPASVVARRLDILGHTLLKAEQSYNRSLKEVLGKSFGYDWPRSLASWQSSIVSRAAQHHELASRLATTNMTITWEDHHLGFPEGATWDVLRALVDVCSSETVELDLTDLHSGGYIDPARLEFTTTPEREPLIILTEGKSDARILRAAVDTLYQDYAEFVRFIDYDFAKAAGGAAEVVRFVRMFAGSGIKNRVVALFDNDTAGQQACKEIGKLPDNVYPLCLPSLPMFSMYPTLGPDGLSVSNIDARACALELYLGRQALSDEQGELRPVRWTGFNEKEAKYQGEVSCKDRVQARFEEILAEVRANPSRRKDFDFSGVEAIFDSILAQLTSR